MQPTAGSGAGTPGTGATAGRPPAGPSPLSCPDGVNAAAEGSAAAATAPPDAIDADAPHTILQRAFPPECDASARPCLIDLRDASAFMGSRLRDSFNVPLEALVPRMFILPDRATPLGLIVGGPPEQQKVLGAAAGGGAKQEVEVGAFLSSRGWRVAFCAEATPLLWRAAEEAGLLEVGGDPVTLQRRWPFQPSKLLLQQAPLLEELLVRSWVQRQLQPKPKAGAETGMEAKGQEGQGRGGAAPGLPRSPKVTLRMLDVGCGSGRDLAWLSTRRSTVTMAVPVAGPSAAAQGAGESVAAAAATDGAEAAEPSGREVEVAVSWECVGLDSWHGALQRAAEVLDLGAVPTGPGGVTLHLVQIGGSASGAAAAPAAAAATVAGSGGAGSAGAVEAAAGPASGTGASGCPLRPLPLPGAGAGGGSDGGGGGEGAKGPAAKKAKKCTGGKGAELLMRYLAGQGGADRLGNGSGDAVAAAVATARPPVPVVPATAQPVLPPAPVPPGLGPDAGSTVTPTTAAAAAGATAPMDASSASFPAAAAATAAAAAAAGGAAATAAPGSSASPASPPPPDLGGPFDLVLCVRFLERSFLPHLPRLLCPGGVLLYSTFVDGPGLRAFGRPSGREHVLQRDELAGSMFGPAQGFQVLRDDVDLTADGREVSMFAARKLEKAGEAAGSEVHAEGEMGAGAMKAGAEGELAPAQAHSAGLEAAAAAAPVAE
ncbi:hypothetical protein HYH02_006888 [Chlamydomonas schloesseri]|uniref:Rhodanese domain-containing protein n=1 Tax=Chlamydomonas schloesseri TaxID=2026947 RepID=A0A835WIJ9_9CHLO|nr:hypothetical protein HYH02_006888 [Chlamydomonas schloesseri]|eukprot:KAG2448304.1 hypothetical protein HYH02_006888 [Chlamydomonas schloesseri]